jgi:hypothetical protein
MLVFAFDRDWTVDVNPHPGHEAVPLEWVRHLAHETPHAVYAIGNQTLAEEAAIPGVVDVVGRHPDDWNRWLGEKRPDGRYEEFPRRRERLSLIADLHQDADGYVVVDDLDLSDVDLWEHYHAWEFVPAVERGEIHPDLPWVRDPVTDGGASARCVEPADATALSSFLDDHAEAPGFELTYTDAGMERTTAVADLEPGPRSFDRSPVFKCVPLAPGRDRFDVTVDAIERLAVVDIDGVEDRSNVAVSRPSAPDAGATSPSDGARGVRAAVADGAGYPSSLDRALDALGHPYRRRLLLLVGERGRDEDEVPVEAVAHDDEDLDLLGTELYHVHLPRLAEAGYVEWDRDLESVRRGPNFGEVAPLLALMRERREALPDGWPRDLA